MRDSGQTGQRQGQRQAPGTRTHARACARARAHLIGCVLGPRHAAYQVLQVVCHNLCCHARRLVAVNLLELFLLGAWCGVVRCCGVWLWCCAFLWRAARCAAEEQAAGGSAACTVLRSDARANCERHAPVCDQSPPWCRPCCRPRCAAVQQLLALAAAVSCGRSVLPRTERSCHLQLLLRPRRGPAPAALPAAEARAVRALAGPMPACGSVWLAGRCGARAWGPRAVTRDVRQPNGRAWFDEL
jgi:hypothetical protein